MKKRYIALIFYFILLFVPTYWMVITSIKTDDEILKEFTFIPKNITFENYMEILILQISYVFQYKMKPSVCFSRKTNENVIETQSSNGKLNEKQCIQYKINWNLSFY